LPRAMASHRVREGVDATRQHCRVYSESSLFVVAAGADGSQQGRELVKKWWMTCVAALGVVLAGCGSSASCKDACDRLQSCNLNSSGFSCDMNCASPQSTCAQCVNGNSCSDITTGKCSSSCANVSFTPN